MWGHQYVFASHRDVGRLVPTSCSTVPRIGACRHQQMKSVPGYVRDAAGIAPRLWRFPGAHYARAGNFRCSTTAIPVSGNLTSQSPRNATFLRQLLLGKIHRLTWLNKKAPDFVRNVTAEENRGEVLDFGPGSIEPQLSA
jgi:hypothetical protein